jgi:ubiquinone/menaquinone biosynthesis C-methylase UbiE
MTHRERDACEVARKGILALNGGMPIEEHAIERTRQTYDRYASEHAARFWNASVARAWDVFTSLLPPNALVLDLGCGAGRDVAALGQRGCRVIGVDLSIGLLREAQDRVKGEFVQADMRAIPFKTAQFDGVWMCASFLHIPRQQAPKVLAQVNRVMGWGSLIYIAVKQGEGESWQGADGPRFFTYYQPDEIASSIQDCGFSVETSWIEETSWGEWVNIIARK